MTCMLYVVFFSEIVGLEFYLNVLLNLDLNEMITLSLLI